MKHELPKNHGLSTEMIENLVFKNDDGYIELTDVQYKALENGIANGKNTLIVSPTSTGKTQIAIWAMAKNLMDGLNVVYLVTHRSLAKQKFNEFKETILENYLDGDLASLVVATGDYVIDAEGESVASPLESPLLIATYEKYLALLSAHGVPKSMASTVVLCDEIQYIGDEHRGQNIEVLITLIKNAKCKQFIGLSAVLQKDDAKELANWLGIELIYTTTREKHLSYELYTPNKVFKVNTGDVDNIEESSHSLGQLDTLVMINRLLEEANPPTPIIVFCMKKADVYVLSEKFIESYKKKPIQGTFDFSEIPQTSSNAFLSISLTKKTAIHSADLLDEEREVVENQASNGSVDVIFATSTLAAGVNFPFGVAIFHQWGRWNFDQQRVLPIDSSEFHNMAGRVGRMGFGHEYGRVIFFASNTEIRNAKKYLNIGEMPKLKSRINSNRFNHLCLQLVSSNLCKSYDEVRALICNTFSALKVETENTDLYNSWPNKIHQAITELVEQRFLIIAGDELQSTTTGKAIALSMLLPETGAYFINYVAHYFDKLEPLIYSTDNEKKEQLIFSLFTMCFTSPEYKTTRNIPHLFEREQIFDAQVYIETLPDPLWFYDHKRTNAAKISLDWINGTQLSTLETIFSGLRAGVLTELFRNLTWILQGFSTILVAISDVRTSKECKPFIFDNYTNEHFNTLKLFVRVLRQLAFRTSVGLPKDVLWLTSLQTVNPQYKLSRHEILAFLEKDFIKLEQLVLGTPKADEIRKEVFEYAKPAPIVKSNWLRDTCRDWKKIQREKAQERHLKRVSKCKHSNLVKEFYEKKGTQFEDIFEQILKLFRVRVFKLDSKQVTGAPDYLLKLNNSEPIIFELKSKEGANLVNYNDATEVLAASEIHGYCDCFCVTLCHPGVDPSVADVIANCGRLSVIESHDLGEALVRHWEGRLTQEQLWQWLTTPGQALSADLPFKENIIY